MRHSFPIEFNPHYDFSNPKNQNEILRQDKLRAEGALVSMTPYQAGGGSITPSPWGSNQSIDAGRADSDTLPKYLAQYGLKFSQLINADALAERVQPVEFCVKDLTVKPGHQLSLQSHQGREEVWIVKRGILTVIVDGQRINVEKGQGIFVPKKSVHCMNNCTDELIVIEELQLGICREEDNVRLLDSTRDESGLPAPRPTYPITNEIQYQSAILFAEVATEIALQKGMTIDPQFATLHQSVIDN